MAVEAGLTVYAYNFNIPWALTDDSRAVLGACHASD